MEEKLKQVVHLLQEIDDELNNKMCLEAEAAGFDEEDCGLQFTFWGVADMIIDYMQRRNNDE
jgi:hypothetical protein